jgi:hypothetical protein
MSFINFIYTGDGGAHCYLPMIIFLMISSLIFNIFFYFHFERGLFHIFIKIKSPRNPHNYEKKANKENSANHRILAMCGGLG